MRWLAFIAALSCGPQAPEPQCVSACGLKLRGYTEDAGMPDNWTCASFQAAETKALYLLSAYTYAAQSLNSANGDDRLKQGCPALKDWSLWVHDTPSWFDPVRNYSIVGQTGCDGKSIEIGWSAIPGQTALAHEFAHAIQRCWPRMPVDWAAGEDWGHASWTRDGIFAADLEDSSD
jgi:hypothetical protein